LTAQLRYWEPDPSGDRLHTVKSNTLTTAPGGEGATSSVGAFDSREATVAIAAWSDATERGVNLSPASRGIVDAVRAFGASLVGEVPEDEREVLIEFACHLIEGPIRAGLLFWAGEITAERETGA
jgi:hypothetical protein